MRAGPHDALLADLRAAAVSDGAVAAEGVSLAAGRLVELLGSSPEVVLRHRASFEPALPELAALLQRLVGAAGGGGGAVVDGPALAAASHVGELAASLLDGGLRASPAVAAALARPALGACAAAVRSVGWGADAVRLVASSATLAGSLLVRCPSPDEWCGGTRGAGEGEEEGEEEGAPDDDAGSSAAPPLPAGHSLLADGLTPELARPLLQPLEAACNALAEALGAPELLAASLAAHRGGADGSAGGAAAAAAAASLLPGALRAARTVGMLACEAAALCGGGAAAPAPPPSPGDRLLGVVVASAGPSAVALASCLPGSSDGLGEVLSAAGGALAYTAHRGFAAGGAPGLSAEVAPAVALLAEALPLAAVVAKAWLAACLATGGRASAASVTPDGVDFSWVTGGVRPKAARGVHAEVHSALLDAATASLHAAVAVGVDRSPRAVTATLTAALAPPDAPLAPLHDAQMALLLGAGLPPGALPPGALPAHVSALTATSPVALSHGAAALARAAVAAGPDAAPALPVLGALNALVVARVAPRLASGLRDVRRYSATLQSQLLGAGARVARAVAALLAARADVRAALLAGAGSAAPVLASLHVGGLVDAATGLLGGDGAAGAASAPVAGGGVAHRAVDLLAALPPLLAALQPVGVGGGDADVAALAARIVTVLVSVVSDGFAFLRLHAAGCGGGGAHSAAPARGAVTVDGRAAGARLTNRWAAAAAGGDGEEGEDGEDGEDGNDEAAALTLHAAAALRELLAATAGGAAREPGAPPPLPLGADARGRLVGLSLLLARCASAPRVFDDDEALDDAGRALEVALEPLTR